LKELDEALAKKK
jgi:hypothetical protein